VPSNPPVSEQYRQPPNFAAVFRWPQFPVPIRNTLDRLSTAATPGRCTRWWAAIAVCATVDRRGARPRLSDTRRRRSSTGAGRSRPTTTSVGRPARSGLSCNARRRADLPVQQLWADGHGRRLDKFLGVGYPGLDKLATHELTLLPGRLLASAVRPAKMRFASDELTRAARSEAARSETSR